MDNQNNNNNPQMNNQNSNQPINVIPNMSQKNNSQIKPINPINDALNLNKNNEMIQNSHEEVNPLLNKENNKFINNNIDTTRTSLNNLNSSNGYSNLPKVDYSKDPKVQENLNRGNTVNVNSEGKIFIIIVVILLLFIIVMPTIFDLISKIKY